MKPLRPPLLLICGCLAASGVAPARAASFRVTFNHDLDEARPAEVLVLPFAEVRARLPEVLFDHVQVRREDTGEVVPAQVTNFSPNLRPALYDDLIWQHDFAVGEDSATFLIETTENPVPPFPSRVFARHVPERLDDFAWENDRMGHRAYGAALDSPAAGSSRLRSSGIDFWAKRVRYLIVDRWYLKGHDAYHVDTGEGLDLYSVGTNRGVGGTAVHDGADGFHTAENWSAVRVLANGPLRAVFELEYAPWPAGQGIRVSETRRFIVDAGQNLDRIESTFTIEGADEVVVGFGLTTREELNPVDSLDLEAGWMSNWSEYPEGEGSLGTGVVLEPGKATGHARDGANRYLLATVRDGGTVTCYAGGGWTLAGDFDARGDWENYLGEFARRLRHPVTFVFNPAD